MTSYGRHCEPKAKKSTVYGQLIGFMESLHEFRSPLESLGPAAFGRRGVA
jgi:hypothetical protein